MNSPADESGASISSDGVSLYVSGLWDDLKRSGGLGQADIWLTTRKTVADPWGKPVNLGATVNSPRMDESPSISEDGLSLYFRSARIGGYGEEDLWLATRSTTNDAWVEPVNLGPMVNSSYEEGGPSISFDGLTLYFYSNRPGGYGGYDIWVTTRETIDDPWQEPVNLGYLS